MAYDFVFEFIGNEEADIKALNSLSRWLREDLATDHGVKVELQGTAQPGQMGAADVLCTVLTQLTSVGGLAVAVASWRGSRSSARPVRIRLGDATLELADPTAEQLTAALHALAQQGTAGAAPASAVPSAPPVPAAPEA